MSKRIEPQFGWAAVSPLGRIMVFSARLTRREVMKYIPQMGMGADHYQRSTPTARYRYCYRQGWRCIRVKVVPAFVGGQP